MELERDGWGHDRIRDTRVRVEHLDHYFGEGEIRKQVLFDNNLEIGAGEVVMMSGPSGSGKTTLLTLCGGLRSPQAGSVQVLGRELRGLSRQELVAVRKDLGFIFQLHNLFDSLSAIENVRMSLELHGIYGDEATRIGVEMLTRLGLEERVHYKPRLLSGGERQRVAVARALVHRPRLVLADEPTAALDGDSSKEVVALLKELSREQESAILMVTHDPRVLDAADRIITLVDGQVASDLEVSDTTRLCEYLKRSEIFQKLSPTELLDLSEMFERESAPADTVIIRQGDEGDKFYIIGSGKVRVLYKEREIARLGVSDFFGETALLTGEPRNASVVALEPVVLYFLGREEFTRTLEKSETFQEQLRKVAFQRS